jgi:predicted DNA-binding WGR domain protein
VPDERSPVQHAIAMRRVDPDTNMARFYVLTLEQDLFGNFAVTRQWGKVGTAGRVITEPFGTELEAGEAMGRLAALKRRRGYRDL